MARAACEQRKIPRALSRRHIEDEGLGKNIVVVAVHSNEQWLRVIQQTIIDCDYREQMQRVKQKTIIDCDIYDTLGMKAALVGYVL